MTSFEIGTIVVLKSGGPKMTVQNSGRDLFGELFVCTSWFNFQNELKTSNFHPDSLEQA